jgi:hypothetical protein
MGSQVFWRDAAASALTSRGFGQLATKRPRRLATFGGSYEAGIAEDLARQGAPSEVSPRPLRALLS